MSLKEFQKISKLGEGAYSTVYKVIRNSDKQTYALKRIKMTSLTQKQKQNALNQIRILASINHPHVISYKQAFIDENSKSLCIVMEYANNGDLADKIEKKKNNKGVFFEEQIWTVFVGVLKGLRQLHTMGIYHRDIKPANIFLVKQGKDLIAKIGDMNVSKISENNLCMTQTGTPYYASPQVWKDLPYDQKSDIWSLGCVIYQMITLRPPFQAEDMQGLYKKVTRGIYSRIPQDYSNDLSAIIRLLLQINPESRPNCDKILKTRQLANHAQVSNLSEVMNTELMKTIKGENFNQLNQMLPKANYIPSRISVKQRERGLKSVMNENQQLHMLKSKSNKLILEKEEALQLDLIHNDKSKKAKDRSKNKHQNTDRVYIKEKNTFNMLNRERKKSEMSIGRPLRADYKSNSKNSVHNIVDLKELSELKLPKVQNRYNRIKQRLNKQNSLRIHKVFND